MLLAAGVGTGPEAGPRAGAEAGSGAEAEVGLWRLAPRANAQSDGDGTSDEPDALPIVRLIPEELVLPEGIGTIDLTLENGPTFQTITIWIYLDPERFAVTSITQGPLLAAAGATLAHEISDGYLTLRAVVENPAAEERIGDGAIARIGIAALQAGSGEIAFDGIELLDMDGGAIEALAEGAVAVEAESEPGPETLEDVVAQATALAESAVQGGLPDSNRQSMGASIGRSMRDLGPTAAWLALLAAAAGVTCIAWLVGRDDEPPAARWTAEIGPDEHHRSML